MVNKKIQHENEENRLKFLYKKEYVVKDNEGYYKKGRFIIRDIPITSVSLPPKPLLNINSQIQPRFIKKGRFVIRDIPFSPQISPTNSFSNLTDVFN